MAEDSVKLLIKNPTDEPGTPPFTIDVPLSNAIGDLKQEIAARYPSHPEPERQRLIFSGKLLVDDAVMRNVLSGFDTSAPQTFHLVTSGRMQASVDGSSPRFGEASVVPPTDHMFPAAQSPFGRTELPPYVAHGPPPPPGDVPYGFYAGPAYPMAAGYPQPMHPYLGNVYYPHLQTPLLPDEQLARGFPASPFMVPGAIPMADDRQQFHAPYGNVGAVDPAYVAHLEAMQQRFAQELAAHHHQHLYRNQQEQNAFPFQHQAPLEGHAGLGLGGGLPGGVNQDQAGVAAINGHLNAGAPGNGNGPWVRQYVFQFELNWSLISKLILLVVLLGQEGSSQRLYVLGGSAVLIYLWQTGRLGVMRRFANNILPNPTQMFELIVPAMARSEGPQQERLISRTAVALSHVYSFIYGFLCSLLPSWEPVQLPRVDDILNADRTLDRGAGEPQNASNGNVNQGVREGQDGGNENHQHAE
jgi:hypothetical protein